MEADEAFGEGGSGGVLAGFLEGLLGLEGGGFVAGDKFGGVVGGEQGLSGGVGVGAEGGVTVFGVVFAVVEDDDTAGGEDGWRAYFWEAAVEVAGALGEDFDGCAGGVFDGGPVDEVGGGGEVDGAFAPEHPVFSFDLCGEDFFACEAGDDAAGFVLEVRVLAVGAGVVTGAEGGAVLGPVEEVFGGGDADGVGYAVPLGVGEDVGAVGRLDDAGVFDSAGPLAGLLSVGGGVEDGFGQAGEGGAVGG